MRTFTERKRIADEVYQFANLTVFPTEKDRWEFYAYLLGTPSGYTQKRIQVAQEAVKNFLEPNN